MRIRVTQGWQGLLQFDGVSLPRVLRPQGQRSVARQLLPDCTPCHTMRVLLYWCPCKQHKRYAQYIMLGLVRGSSRWLVLGCQLLAPVCFRRAHRASTGLSVSDADD